MIVRGRSLAFLCCLLWATICDGQLVNCNGFMKGNFVEAGMNWNGAFGASTAAPAGFHPTNSSNLRNAQACGGATFVDPTIGFMADPDKDGWESGLPAKFGDFLLPGSGMEGWSYMADGAQVNAWNSDALMTDTLTGGLTSYFMSYSDTLGVKTLKSQGVKNGVYITQIFTLKDNDLYIRDEVIIENTNLFTISNIYFMRMFNAHSDRSESGLPETKNKIEFALPDSLTRTIISARGTSNPKGYMAIATQDFRAVGFIYPSGALPATTIDNIASGSESGYLYHQNDSIVGNSAIGLVFDIGNLASVGSAHFTLLYAFSPAVFDSTLTTVDTTNAVATLSTPETGVYPNPFQDEISINNVAVGSSITVYDIVGKPVAMRVAQQNNEHLNIPAVAPGNYILTVTDRTGAIIQRRLLNKR